MSDQQVFVPENIKIVLPATVLIALIDLVKTRAALHNAEKLWVDGVDKFVADRIVQEVDRQRTTNQPPPPPPDASKAFDPNTAEAEQKREALAAQRAAAKGEAGSGDKAGESGD